MEELRRFADALALIRSEHPSATISKIRHMEATGQVSAVVDRDGNRWVRAGDICRAITAEQQSRHVEDHEACSVVLLRPRRGPDGS